LKENRLKRLKSLEMELTQLNSLLAAIPGGTEGQIGYNTTAYIEAIQKQWKPLFENQAYKEFDTDFHKIVIDKINRKDKEIFQPTGVTLPDGTVQLDMVKVKVARLPVPFQKIIVGRAVQFLTGGKLNLNSEPKTPPEVGMYTQVKKVWKDNKLQFKNGKIAKAMMSQLECAELWYSEVDTDDTGKEVVTLKMNILTPVDGFTFSPVFDAFGDLLAFGIQWVGVDKTEYFDLYTDTEKRSHQKDKGGNWQLINDAEGNPAIFEHGYGKIPVIYYTQLKSEWHPVQRIIERYETLISNFADINDYNGSPILYLKGTGNSLPAKGQAGKVIENPDGNGDAKYITWDQAPQAIELEINNLENLIYSMTQTAPIDFENMKGLGQLSGVAFDRILIDSHLKAREKQNDTYGECIQRRINFLIAATAAIDAALKAAQALDIEPDFDIFRIDDQADKVALITQANGGKPVISQQTSIRLAGMVDDTEAEWLLIQAENDFLGGQVELTP
jgi:SPP1 family phage portal protein